MEDNTTIAAPYDHFFRQIMAIPYVAKDFFEDHCDELLKQLLDLNSLELMSSSFVDEKLKGRESDLLFKVNMQNEPIFLYLLLEHQSSPDKSMPIRIVNYIHAIMEKYKLEKEEQCYPLVLPMVFYHGKVRYPYSTDIRDFIRAPKALIDKYYGAPFQLEDITQAKDEKGENVMSSLITFVYRYSRVRDFRDYLGELIRRLETIKCLGKLDFADKIMYYAYAVLQISHQDWDEAVRSMKSKELRGDSMTLAEQYRQEGMQRGLQKGMQQGLQEGMQQGLQEGIQRGLQEGELNEKVATAHKMLAEGVEIEFIAKITGLSKEKIGHLDSI